MSLSVLLFWVKKMALFRRPPLLPSPQPQPRASPDQAETQQTRSRDLPRRGGGCSAVSGKNSLWNQPPDRPAGGWTNCTVVEQGCLIWPMLASQAPLPLIYGLVKFSLGFCASSSKTQEATRLGHSQAESQAWPGGGLGVARWWAPVLGPSNSSTPHQLWAHTHGYGHPP